jgi:hypothetical protein
VVFYTFTFLKRVDLVLITWVCLYLTKLRQKLFCGQPAYLRSLFFFSETDIRLELPIVYPSELLHSANLGRLELRSPSHLINVNFNNFCLFVLKRKISLCLYFIADVEPVSIYNEPRYRHTTLHFISIPSKYGARGSVVGWGTMLQAGRYWVRIPMRSLDFQLT